MLQAKAAENDGAFLAGLHLEGPYFAPSQKGAQDERYIVPPRREHYEKILEKANGSILRWSVAPELEGAMELGRRLMREGILPSIGIRTRSMKRRWRRSRTAIHI